MKNTIMIDKNGNKLEVPVRKALDINYKCARYTVKLRDGITLGLQYHNGL